MGSSLEGARVLFGLSPLSLGTCQQFGRRDFGAVFEGHQHVGAFGHDLGGGGHGRVTALSSRRCCISGVCWRGWVAEVIGGPDGFGAAWGRRLRPAHGVPGWRLARVDH